MRVIDLDTNTLTASSWTGGIVAALLLDGARHKALADCVVTAVVPYGQLEPVAQVEVNGDLLKAVSADEDLPSEARLRATLALDLLSSGAQPASFSDFVGGDWAHTSIERVLRILWAYLVGDGITPPPAWPTS
ncbi:hypothetical protein [Euzebya pacifica]|uniref:hypothetical protein n=1 Tax=Euzebya pacifica TaxID=1608957 RepID=UPI0030FA8DAE